MTCTKYEHLMLPGAFLDKVTQDFDFKGETGRDLGRVAQQVKVLH